MAALGLAHPGVQVDAHAVSPSRPPHHQTTHVSLGFSGFSTRRKTEALVLLNTRDTPFVRLPTLAALCLFAFEAGNICEHLSVRL